MSDNINYTPGAGGTVLADEVTHGTLGTGKVAYVKLMNGALDDTTELAFVNSRIPVNVAGQFNTTPGTRTTGAASILETDSVGNLKVVNQGQSSYTQDSISSYAKGYSWVNLTASGQALATAGVLVGWHVNSSSGSPTIRFSNATTSTSPYFGVAFTPNAGITPIPVTEFQNGCYVTISGTIDITLFVRSGMGA